MFSLKILMCFRETAKMRTYAAWLPIPTSRTLPKQVVSISFSTWLPFPWQECMTVGTSLPALCQGQNADLTFLATEKADKMHKSSCSFQGFNFDWMKKIPNKKTIENIVFNRPFFIIFGLLQLGAILWSSLFLFSGDTRAGRE